MQSFQTELKLNTFDPTTLKHFISKKTLRGRKIKSPLPNTARCCICLEFEEYSSEQLISCSICKAMIHPSCYHQKFSEDDYLNFTCQRCKKAFIQKREIVSFKCLVCDESDGILISNECTGECYHSTCIKLIHELANETDEEKITRTNIRKWRYKNSCKYCNSKLSKNKAVIKCANPKCKDFYHIPCAIEKGMIFSLNYLTKYYQKNPENDLDNSIPFFCSCHNKRLAASYRSDVIYSDQLFPSDKLNLKRKLSSSVEEECSTTNECLSTEGTNDQSESYLNSVGSEEEYCGDCNSLNFSKNSIMFLDFTEIHIPQREDIQEINFFNISHKENFPLNFEYEKF
jgi:hypothetical protein